jgi:hypothetical protein
MIKIMFAVVASLFLALSAHSQTNGVYKVVVNDVTYSLMTNQIVATMIDGSGDKYFTASIHGKGLYGFTVYGYGEGFPTYGIIPETSSGGVIDNYTLRFYFNDGILNSNDGKPKVYEGRIKIHVYQGSETGFDTNFLYLPVKVTVYP